MTDLDFGKYRGKTLQQVMLRDPDYVFWAYEKNLFKRKPPLAAKAAELVVKAKNIKIPVPDPENWCVIYFRDGRGALADVWIIPKSELKHYTEEYSLLCIDLSIPRQWKNYDKYGGQIMIKVLKKEIFKEEHIRFTKQRCDDFFANPQNFLPGLKSPSIIPLQPTVEPEQEPWPAPGSEDTELGVLMELEVDHGETEVYTRV